MKHYIVQRFGYAMRRNAKNYIHVFFLFCIRFCIGEKTSFHF